MHFVKANLKPTKFFKKEIIFLLDKNTHKKKCFHKIIKAINKANLPPSCAKLYQVLIERRVPLIICVV